MTDDAFHNVKPPILTKSEKQTNCAGKGDGPRAYSKSSEEAYRNNKFWDNCNKDEGDV